MAATHGGVKDLLVGKGGSGDHGTINTHHGDTEFTEVHGTATADSGGLHPIGLRGRAEGFFMYLRDPRASEVCVDRPVLSVTSASTRC
jgi:hypothetical protein